MQQRLHVVGVTEDGNGLLLAARRGARTGRYVISIDDALLDTIETAGSDDGGDDASEASAALPHHRAASSESKMSVREVQDRLRSGWSVAEVASRAGVDADWVERFAVPIRAEQQQWVARAQAMVMEKRRVGESARPLGESVEWNVADKGVRMTSAELQRSWSAYVARGAWIVRFSYRSRGREQVAEWDVTVDAIVPRDTLAGRLGYLERARRGAPPLIVEAPEPAEDEPAPTRTKRAAAKKKAAGKKAAKTRPAAKKKAAGKKAAKTRPAAKKKAAKPAAKKRPAAKKKAAGKKAAKKRPAAKTKAPARRIGNTAPPASPAMSQARPSPRPMPSPIVRRRSPERPIPQPSTPPLAPRLSPARSAPTPTPTPVRRRQRPRPPESEHRTSSAAPAEPDHAQVEAPEPVAPEPEPTGQMPAVSFPAPQKPVFRADVAQAGRRRLGGGRERPLRGR